MQSVDRICKIIEAVVDSRDGIGVIEISEAVELPASTTHRILSSLVDLNYLVQDRISKKYTPGRVLFSISGKLVRENSLAELGRPFLMDLSDKTGETVHFCVLEDNKTYLVDKVRSNKNLTHTSNMSFRDEPYITSFGKVLLANMNDDKINEYLASTALLRRTPNTITDREELRFEFKKIRDQGYAIDNEEAEEGLFCIAAPIYDSKGQVSAAISISGPAFRIKDDFDKNLKFVLQTAGEMSKAIGWKLSNRER
jgi:DNA-binding IclR family transcriptional regulator